MRDALRAMGADPKRANPQTLQVLGIEVPDYM
jgi:hypothetical protein